MAKAGKKQQNKVLVRVGHEEVAVSEEGTYPKIGEAERPSHEKLMVIRKGKTLPK
jgi:hypothetical protein